MGKEVNSTLDGRAGRSPRKDGPRKVFLQQKCDFGAFSEGLADQGLRKAILQDFLNCVKVARTSPMNTLARTSSGIRSRLSESHRVADSLSFL